MAWAWKAGRGAPYRARSLPPNSFGAEFETARGVHPSRGARGHGQRRAGEARLPRSRHHPAPATMDACGRPWPRSMGAAGQNVRALLTALSPFDRSAPPRGSGRSARSVPAHRSHITFHTPRPHTPQEARCGAQGRRRGLLNNVHDRQAIEKPPRGFNSTNQEPQPPNDFGGRDRARARATPIPSTDRPTTSVPVARRPFCSRPRVAARRRRRSATAEAVRGRRRPRPTVACLGRPNRAGPKSGTPMASVGRLGPCIDSGARH